MNTVIFNEIVGIVVQIIVLVLGGLLIPYVKAQIGEAKYAKVLELVDIGVAAAEQIYKSMPKSEEKNEARYTYVVDFLNDKGVKITDAELEALIESAVLQISGAVE